MRRIASPSATALVALTCTAVLAVHGQWPLVVGAPWWHRGAYMLCHANVFHLMANLLALATIARSPLRPTWRHLALAAVIALTPPATHQPVVGLSGLVYALLGLFAPRVARPWRYHAVNLAAIAAGLIAPAHFAVGLHLWCYAVGVAVASTPQLPFPLTCSVRVKN